MFENYNISGKSCGYEKLQKIEKTGTYKSFCLSRFIGFILYSYHDCILLTNANENKVYQNRLQTYKKGKLRRFITIWEVVLKNSAAIVLLDSSLSSLNCLEYLAEFEQTEQAYFRNYHVVNLI